LSQGLIKLDTAASTREAIALPVTWQPNGRLLSRLALIAADVVAWLFCVLAVYIIRTIIWGPSPLFWALWVTGVGWIAFRFASGLYPPIGLPQPEVLRRSVRTTGAAGLIHLSVLLAMGEYAGWRLIGLAIWVPVVPLSYFCRAFAASLLRRKRLFGEPYVVIGTGEKARSAIREMQSDWELGLVPVGVFGTLPPGEEKTIEGVPVLGSIDKAETYRFPYRISRALIATKPQEIEGGHLRLADRLARVFPSIHVLPEMLSPSNQLVNARAIGPYLALEMRHARFSTQQKFLKRLFDLALTVPIFILALPIIAIAALLVKWFSPGPAFFSQKREGLNGQEVRIWKIRTMITDAEKRLAEYLASNPAARFEYERTLKLRHDPRVIPRIGSFLRRASIDELPQLWNIIRGDMSLVGPRIMPVAEVGRYSESGQNLRRDVPPGLTGLWQIMYRNNSDLHIREVADSYYVNNWSIWMDSWILFRTVRVVFGGSGAF
jgi:Undecaprenyl-phosphate galactose phosphotransferase WbaP